jgi:iron complex outermembrane receptor protein
MKLLYGSAYRPANIYEMYYQDYITTKANPNLKPEYLDNYEYVVEYSLNENTLLTLSGYYFEITDMISQVTDRNTGLAVFRNEGKGIGRGIEFEFNTRLDCGLWLNANYAFQRTRNAKTNQLFSNSPEHIAKLTASKVLFDDFTAGAQFVFESERHSEFVEGTYTSSEAYMLTDLFLKYTPVIETESQAIGWLNNLTISMKVYNLFNTKYSHPTSIDFTQTFLNQDGRKFLFEVGYKF